MMPKPKLTITDRSSCQNGVDETLKDLQKLRPKIEMIIVRALLFNGEAVEWYAINESKLKVRKKK